MQRFQYLISEGPYYHVSPENVPSLSFSSFICNTQTHAGKSSPSAACGFLETATPTRLTVDTDINESSVLTAHFWISVILWCPVVSLYVISFQVADSKN